MGIGFIAASILPGFLGLGELRWGHLNLPFASCFLAFVAVGGFLIRRRNTPISWAAKAVLTLSVFILVGFTVVIVIPDFVRSYYQSSANGCVNNLRQVAAAKEMWALENHKTNGTAVTEDDLKPYIKLDSHGNIPRCGLGGKYILGPVGEDPQCSIGTSMWPNSHILNDTNIYNWRTNFKLAYSRLFGLQAHRQND